MDKPPRSISGKTALRLAIFALKTYRQRHHAIGHNAYMLGQVFTFNKRDHEAYEKFTRAIKYIEALIPALEQISRAPGMPAASAPIGEKRKGT